MRYNNPNKYKISDETFKTNLNALIDGFSRLESFYNNKIFRNGTPRDANPLESLNSENGSTYLNVNTQGSDGEVVENNPDVSLNMTTEFISAESYRSAQLSDFIENLNIGVLIPLNCGHNGLYSHSEMEMLSFYLLNSKFI